MARRHYNLRKGTSTLEVEYVRDTKNSWYLDIGNNELVWFPKKHCTYDKDAGTIEVPNQFLDDENLR